MEKKEIMNTFYELKSEYGRCFKEMEILQDRLDDLEQDYDDDLDYANQQRGVAGNRLGDARAEIRMLKELQMDQKRVERVLLDKISELESQIDIENTLSEYQEEINKLKQENLKLKGKNFSLTYIMNLYIFTR